MADRWMYVPMIGIWIAVAWTVATWARSQQVAVAMGAAAVVVALAVQTRAQVRVWRDTQTLFTRAIEVTEGNRVAHFNLAWYLAEKGHTDEAIAHYQSAIEIAPRYFAPRYNLAWILWEQGRTDEAVKATCEALRVAEPEMRAYRKRMLEWLEGRRCP
jgi:tetratricopeptide (TPR) repeat protein